MEVSRFSKHQHIQKQAEKMSSLLLTFSHNGKFSLFTLRHDAYVRAFSRQTCAFGSLGFPSSLSRRRRRCRHRCLKSLVFSRDVTVAMLVYLNNRKAAMLLFPTNPLGIELCYHANVLLFRWKTRLLIT